MAKKDAMREQNAAIKMESEDRKGPSRRELRRQAKKARKERKTLRRSSSATGQAPADEAAKEAEDDVQADRLIVRKGENRIIGRIGEEVMYKLLTPDISGAIEFCLMEIPAGVSSSDVPREHTGEEVAYIISGEIDLHLSGTVHHLESGDSVRIPPMSPHRWVNCYDSDFKAVFAITPPSF